MTSIKESLFGPSRKALSTALRAFHGLVEIRRVWKDEACVKRLGDRGYLNNEEQAALYRKMLRKVTEL